MTNFLTIDRLQAHEAPVDLRSALRDARPVLKAQWLIAADGKFVCHWVTGDPAPDRPAASSIRFCHAEALRRRVARARDSRISNGQHAETALWMR